MSSFILHIMISEKFIPSFIDFVEAFDDDAIHRYVMITSEKYEYGLTKDHNVEFIYKYEDFDVLLQYMLDADKIFLHGLWREKVCNLLIKNPTLYLKTYWIMWGGDFYHQERYSNAQVDVMRNVSFLIAMTDESVAFVREKYGAIGKHIRCFVYPSNIVYPHAEKLNFQKRIDNINLLVGNSGVESNNHIAVFNMLSHKNLDNVNVCSVLSYPARNEYINEVIKQGKLIFGSRFNPIVDFMSYEDYLDFISKIDVAFFDAWRQQGMGNIVQLLNSGARVYMRNNVSTWGLCQFLGIKVFDIQNDDIILLPLASDVATRNSDIVRNYFSAEKLKRDLKFIFNE